MNEQILVGIYCITYNHNDYLRHCLDGFVMQQTNFRFVAVVHDDCSTDGTTDILREYAEKYPDIIHPIYEEENQYSKHNGEIGRKMNEAFNQLGVKYIAMCEGDDYWTDPLKLQKQVDFLETHPDYSMCFTNCRTKLEDSYGVANHTIWDTYSIEDIIRHNSLGMVSRKDEIVSPGHTSTIVYRRPLEGSLSWISRCFIGDEPLFVALGQYGNAKFLNEFTSVYRKNIGVSSKNWSFEKDARSRIEMYRVINECLNYKYKTIIKPIISSYYWSLCKLYWKIGNKKESVRCGIYSFVEDRHLIINWLLKR